MLGGTVIATVLLVWSFLAFALEVPPGTREILFSDGKHRPLSLLQDLDGDGIFETRTVFKAGKAWRRLTDKDQDGKPEEEVILDPKGAPQELILDRNRDGKPDKWQFYRGGSPYLIREDNNFDGRPDLEARLKGKKVLLLRRDEDGDGCFEYEEQSLEGGLKRVSIKKFTSVKKCEGRIWLQTYYRGKLPLKRLGDEDLDGHFEVEELFKDGRRCLVLKKSPQGKTEAFWYKGSSLAEGFLDQNGDGLLERKYDYTRKKWFSLPQPLTLGKLRKRCGP